MSAPGRAPRGAPADEDAVGTVRAWLAALNAGDVAGVLARTAPGVVLVGPRGAAVGRDALRVWLGHAGATFTTRATYAGGDAVVVAQHGVWRDAAGGVRGEADVATRFRVVERWVVELERYDAVAAALEAAGLTAAEAVAGVTDQPECVDAARRA